MGSLAAALLSVTMIAAVLLLIFGVRLAARPEERQRGLLLKCNIQLTDEGFEANRSAETLEEGDSSSLIRQAQQRTLRIADKRRISRSNQRRSVKTIDRNSTPLRFVNRPLQVDTLSR